MKFTADYEILSMMSSEKELVNLTKTISTAEARGAVEKWLLQVRDSELIVDLNFIELILWYLYG